MKKIILVAMLIANVVFLAQEVSIRSIRENNSSGEPKLSGQTFTVKGVVTSSNNFGNNGPASIQDSSAGISIYGSAFANTVNIGDSVIITASLTQYKGLTQLNAVVPTVLSSNNEVEPKIVTLSQIENQNWNGIEEYESELVKIKDVIIDATGTFGGGKNYTITDATGSLKLRVDNDVSTLIGSPIPSGKVDLIGIVGQYKYGAPYNSGYQIISRSIDDIVTEDVPIILTPVIGADVTINSFAVYFKTARNGNSEVMFGKTKKLELGSVIIEDDTTEHKIELSGLDEFTKYYYRAISTNSVGISKSKVRTIITASSNPTTGTINVYFNSNVDTTVAIKGNNANGNIDFREKIIYRINQAQYSIDIALYSFFGLPNVESALIAAKNRGVKIRFVYESREMQSGTQTLLNAGVLMSQKPDNTGLMHDKFAIFDARDSNPANDWVWMGSWNWTSLELKWYNNVIEINDPSLADTYTTEFEEMWGSNTETPDPAKAKFGNNKSDNTTHNFTVGEIKVESYFSPSDNTELHIANAIGTADTSIYFALLAFTSNPIYNAIKTQHDNYSVTDGRGLISDAKLSGSDFAALQTLFPNEIIDHNGSQKIHNKFGIVDAANVTSDPIVITGSHNWSRAANEKNDENTLIIHDINIANQYMQAFKALYNADGGTTKFSIPTIVSVNNAKHLPTEFTLEQNYPNPFNPTTSITYSISKAGMVNLNIYNLLGQKVTTLVERNQTEGSYKIKFDATNLSSGIYFYRLTSGNMTIIRKMMLLK